MKEYIITIIGATLLSAMASILSPETWRKYISVITGFVIISCIISPISRLGDTDIFSDFDAFYEDKTDYEAVQKNIILNRFTDEISKDIESRFKKEFNEKITASVKLKLNENNEIEKISKIKIKGSDGGTEKTKRLCEIYGIKGDEVEYE